MSQTIALTISRQVASGGDPLGRLLAQRLGFTFLNRAILRESALHLDKNPQAAGVAGDRPAGFWANLLSMFAVSGQPLTGGPAPMASYAGDRHLFEAEAGIISEVAARWDIVLVGRGGFSVLANHPGLVSVFIMAPRLDRARALLEGLMLASLDEALEVLDTCDRERGEFLETMTGRRWSEATNYHLCLDIGRLDLQTAADMIVTMVEKTRQSWKP